MSRINDDAKKTHDIKLSVSICDQIIGGRDFIVLKDGDFKVGDKLLFYPIQPPDMKTILNHEIIDHHAYITDVDILGNGKKVVRETTKSIVQQSQAEELEHERIVEELEKKNAELKKQLADARNSEPSQEIIESAKKQAELEAEEKYKAEMEKLRADAKEAEKTAKEKLKAEKEKAQKAISQSNATESTVAFKFYFGEMQKNLKSFMNTIAAVEDEERKSGFKEAFKKYLSMILDQL